MSEIVIAGNTSGSVTIAAPDVAGTTTLTLPASSGTVLDDASVGVCRAWVNFNGTGTVAIRASFNVSSITDNGTGDYTVNMTNALVDADFSAVADGGVSANVNYTLRINGTVAPTTTTVRIFGSTYGTSLTGVDCLYGNVAIFR